MIRFRPLHSRGGKFLRLIDDEESRELVRSGQAVSLKSGRRVTKLQLVDGPSAERWPAAQASRTVGREYLEHGRPYQFLPSIKSEIRCQRRLADRAASQAARS